MSKIKTVFVSVPMNGKDDMMIERSIQIAKRDYCRAHNIGPKEVEFVKTDIANKLASKLVAEGFVEFFSSENKYEPILDATEIEARIHVVKPTQKGR